MKEGDREKVITRETRIPRMELMPTAFKQFQEL